MATSRKGIGGRPANIKAIYLLQKLNRERPGLKPREKADFLEKKLGYRPDRKNIWRWEKYDLDKVAKL